MTCSHRSALAPLAPALALALLVAACGGDSTGPGPMKPSDPLATAANIQGLDATFTSPAFQSFAFASTYSPAGLSPVAALRTVLRAAGPALGARRALSPTESRLAATALHAVLVAPSGGMSTPILPPAYLGKTFEWTTDPVSGSTAYYPTDRAGAPAKGVRFVLYALDPVYPILPLQEIGYADLIDESTGSVQKLHILAVGNASPRPYLDYAIIGTVTASSGTVTVVGFITDGIDQLDFKAIATETASSLSLDVQFNVNADNVHVRLKVAFTTPTENTLKAAVDFRLQFAAEVVTLIGSETIDLATFEVTGAHTVRVNGGIYALIAISNAGPSYTGGGGQPLTEDDLTALNAIYGAIGAVFLRSDDLLAPVGLTLL